MNDPWYSCRRLGKTGIPAVFVIACYFAGLPPVAAAEPASLSDSGFDSTRQAVVIMQLNWGRTWPCGGFENAQLQALTFTRIPHLPGQETTLELKAKSKLLVENGFKSWAFVIEPGEYAISGYDIKVARSVSQVMHRIVGGADLVHDGVAAGGSFSADPGEIVYVGSFGLDCTGEPIPWRYYIDGRKEFEGFVDGFRAKYPGLKDAPVAYRLFSTTMYGEQYSLSP